MCILPAQNLRGRIHDHIPPLRCVKVVLILPPNCTHSELPRRWSGTPRSTRVLVDCFPGIEVGGDETQDSDHSRNNRGGCNVVLHGHIHLPFRAYDDSGFWTGTCDRSHLLVAVNDTCFSRTRSNFFQQRKSLPTLTVTTLMTFFITTISGNVV